MRGTLQERALRIAGRVEEELRRAGKRVDGSGSNSGRVYSCPTELWSEELRPAAAAAASGENGDGDIGDLSSLPPAVRWYEKAARYWDDEVNCGLDENGMLGGFGEVDAPDCASSLELLDRLRSSRSELGDTKACDCGAGIGRVTRNVLLQNFDEVDLVEQSPRLIAHAPKFIGRGKDRVNFLCLGLQDFMPSADEYDVIWVQWVIGHLHDVDLVKFLQQCEKGLRAGGVIVIKDNTCEASEQEGGGHAFVLDEDDSSIMRSVEYMRSLIGQAGLSVVMEELVDKLPDELHPVRVFVCE